MSDPSTSQRVFLVVVDESVELKVALRYACLRAKKTRGRVALLYVMEPSDGQQWIAIEDIMRQEKREIAEATLSELSAEVADWSGAVPVIYLREGVVRSACVDQRVARDAGCAAGQMERAGGCAQRGGAGQRALMALATSAHACRPEEQKRLIVTAEASTGMPARKLEMRATFMPCSPSGIAHPMITSSIDDGSSCGTRSRAPLMATAPSSSGRITLRVPRGALPTAVLTAETMTASCMFRSLQGESRRADLRRPRQIGRAHV